ncbi:hypothetical protein GCM10012275_28710 [Longimycelium tulufanense]|uniref:Phage FDXHR zinc binding domain-containing protein n=1 Tax=Longimycelium tulufanense TaxID=907463 RepID=A0A8J3CEK4_9PSEU|nr:hypothetical protein GCM10012275_28710 [Longimycelium tulufanense]
MRVSRGTCDRCAQWWYGADSPHCCACRRTFRTVADWDWHRNHVPDCNRARATYDPVIRVWERIPY